MGCEIFIMVALTCSEKSRSCCLACSISFSKKAHSAFFDMYMLSITSPSSSGSAGFRTMVLPLFVTRSMRTSQACVRLMDFSPW